MHIPWLYNCSYGANVCNYSVRLFAICIIVSFWIAHTRDINCRYMCPIGEEHGIKFLTYVIPFSTKYSELHKYCWSIAEHFCTVRPVWHWVRVNKIKYVVHYFQSKMSDSPSKVFTYLRAVWRECSKYKPCVKQELIRVFAAVLLHK